MSTPVPRFRAGSTSVLPSPAFQPGLSRISGFLCSHRLDESRCRRRSRRLALVNCVLFIPTCPAARLRRSTDTLYPLRFSMLPFSPLRSPSVSLSTPFHPPFRPRFGPPFIAPSCPRSFCSPPRGEHGHGIRRRLFAASGMWTTTRPRSSKKPPRSLGILSVQRVETKLMLFSRGEGGEEGKGVRGYTGVFIVTESLIPYVHTFCFSLFPHFFSFLFPSAGFFFSAEDLVSPHFVSAGVSSFFLAPGSTCFLKYDSPWLYYSCTYCELGNVLPRYSLRIASLEPLAAHCVGVRVHLLVVVHSRGRIARVDHLWWLYLMTDGGEMICIVLSGFIKFHRLQGLDSLSSINTLDGELLFSPLHIFLDLLRTSVFMQIL